MTVNGAFSLSNPSMQLYWDSTSLSALKACPRRYQYSIIEGWQGRGEAPDLLFGIGFHAAIERNDHSRAQGASWQEGMRSAMRYVLESTWDPAKQKPLWIGTNHKNRETLLRTVVWYLLQWETSDDPLETIILSNGKPAVELSFRIPLDITLSGETAWLCGHLDKLARLRETEDIYICDKKTTKHALDENYFANYSPDNQMSGYAFGGRASYHLPIKGLVIDAAQVGVTFTRFQRGFIDRTPAQLEEWYYDLRYWLSQAESFAKSGYWPMNDKSCYLCQFKGICGRSPQVRDEWLLAGYAKRVWDPTIVRGDI